MYDIVREEDDYSISIVYMIKVKSVFKKHLFFWHSVKMVRRMHTSYYHWIGLGEREIFGFSFAFVILGLVVSCKNFYLTNKYVECTLGLYK